MPAYALPPGGEGSGCSGLRFASVLRADALRTAPSARPPHPSRERSPRSCSRAKRVDAIGRHGDHAFLLSRLQDITAEFQHMRGVTSCQAASELRSRGCPLPARCGRAARNGVMPHDLPAPGHSVQDARRGVWMRDQPKVKANSRISPSRGRALFCVYRIDCDFVRWDPLK
jgi:hypothetical protein